MSGQNPSEIENHEKNTWESTAEIYAESVGIITALSGRTQLIHEYGGINENCCILDLGCGPGQLTDLSAR